MIEYLILLIIIIILNIIRKSFNHRTEVLALVLLCVYMILLMGLRYRVGMDTISYMRSYEHLPSYEEFKKSDIFENRFEPGYMIICILCKSFCREFWLVQLFFSAVANIGIFIFIYRYCKNPFLGIFIYFIMAYFYFSTEIIRESASISIFILNYENLKKRKWVRYYLYSLLSIGFHFSAIIIWLFPLVPRLKRISKYYIILIVAFTLCIPLFQFLNQYLTGSIAYRLSGNIEAASVFNMNWRIANLIKSATLPILTIYLADKNKIDSQFRPFVLFHILLCAGSFSIPIVFSRFTNYTILFVCVYAANLITSNKISSLAKTAVISIMLVSQSYYYYGMYDSWVPYHSIFEPKRVEKRESMWRSHFHAE